MVVMDFFNMTVLLMRFSRIETEQDQADRIRKNMKVSNPLLDIMSRV